MDPGYDIKQFITTASVARDMVELIEALGRHREREAESIFLGNASSSHSIHLFPHSKGRYTAGKEKLQYWGFSYGTQLGSTFASMFPDRVGRVVLDGVVNAENYGAGLWSDNLHDTEKVMQYFYKTCAAAPGRCPLSNPGSTADDIEAKIQSILADLYHNPMPMSDPDVKFPEVVTYSDIRLVTFGALYTPLFAFPLIADVFSALEQRNVSRFADAIRQLKSCGCQFSCGPSEPQYVNDRESTVSIICGDGPPQDLGNATYFNDHHLKKLERISPTAGAIWSLARLGCTGWKIRPPYRYDQPYGGQTSHPILWVGNTADPVTPVISSVFYFRLFGRC
jgi:pimeloyl-ACP methyl ester carboxylesterase